MIYVHYDDALIRVRIVDNDRRLSALRLLDVLLRFNVFGLLMPLFCWLLRWLVCCLLDRRHRVHVLLRLLLLPHWHIGLKFIHCEGRCQ